MIAVQMIADLDVQSSRGEGVYLSKMLIGTLWIDILQNHVALDWVTAEPLDVIGKISEANRGMELSELILYDGKMLTFDDRTGIVFDLRATIEEIHHLRERKFAIPIRQVDNQKKIKSVIPIPRLVLSEGNGLDTSKGMKVEWATEKDNLLYVGSFGKEFVCKSNEESTSLFSRRKNHKSQPELDRHSRQRFQRDQSRLD